MTKDEKIRAIELQFNNLEEFEKRMNEIKDNCLTVEMQLDTYTIENKRMRDAIALYSEILKRTQNILGENKMTEPIIIKLIEAASYGLWRAIMGGKFDDHDDYEEWYKNALKKKINEIPRI